MWHGAEGCSNLHVLPLHSIGQGEGRAWGPFPALHPWGSVPPAPKPNHTNPGSQYKRLKLIGFFPSKPVGGSRERSAMGWGVGGGERGWGHPIASHFHPNVLSPRPIQVASPPAPLGVISRTAKEAEPRVGGSRSHCWEVLGRPCQPRFGVL